MSEYEHVLEIREAILDLEQQVKLLTMTVALLHMDQHYHPDEAMQKASDVIQQAETLRQELP